MDVAIIGSGFSGLGMAIALQKEGKRSYVVLEKGAGVGGTWRENRYPGCACDVPSHLYSFSFAQNPDWTRHYAGQKEILAYLERCAEEHGVKPHCRFGSEATSCVFDEVTSRWEITTASGDVFDAGQLVLGVGALHQWKFPEVPGRETFAGPQVHSAAWDEAISLEGKRVAVVGTGASAIQLVPAIAPRVKQLTVFQRTPAWIVPRHDAPISRFARWLYRVAPWVMKLTRARIYWRLESAAIGFTRWPRLLAAAEWVGKRHLRSQVMNPALHERLTPKYAAGCKRIIVSDDFYPALNRPNVTLEPSAVTEVTPSGVVTPDGRHVGCDVIVWCTGFEVNASTLKVAGRGGRELEAAWREGAHAYRGTTVAGFPNMYVLLGPNTGLGHNSIIYMIESQIRFAMEHLRALDTAGAKSVEVSEAAEREFNATLHAKLPGTIWASGCTSWYLDAHGKNTTLWPGATFSFRKITRKIDPAHILFSR